MDKSKEELLSTISQQEEALKRYKNRLQDVVAAHKRLIAEKESLEQTLKVTLEKSNCNNIEDNNSTTDIHKNGVNVESTISTLAQSVVKLSAEKSLIESEFQADRKRLISQNKLQEDLVKDLKMQLEREKKLQVIAIENAKSQLILENHKQEIGQKTSITELQELLLEERKQKGSKELQIEELKNQLNEKNCQIVELKNSILESQLQLSKKKLSNPEDKHNGSNNPKHTSDVLNKLKEELKTIQEQHKFAMQQEQQRVVEAEERSRLLVEMHEKRVSKLEDQLTELSNLVSNYDKSRQLDQEAISKLKNRLLNLEVDNINSECEDDQHTLTNEEMIEQITHLKQHLLLNSKSPEMLVQLRDILLADLDDVVEQSQLPGYYLQRQLLQLKQEFNNYREDIINNGLYDRNDDEIISLRKQLQNMEQNVAQLEEKNRELQRCYDEKSEIAEKELQHWKDKLSNYDSDCRNKLMLMDQELTKQRKRTLAVVTEKDKQIDCLKLLQNNLKPYSMDILQNGDTLNQATGSETNSAKADGTNSTLLHYVQDDARKEVDITKLRQLNNKLENRMHEMKRQMYHQEQVQHQHIIKLQDNIRRLERNNNLKDDINVEYLKNVVLNYLLTTDANKRIHMLNAISTVLHFSENETNCIVKTCQTKT